MRRILHFVSAGRGYCVQACDVDAVCAEGDEESGLVSAGERVEGSAGERSLVVVVGGGGGGTRAEESACLNRLRRAERL
jgi:hypothetical protein